MNQSGNFSNDTGYPSNLTRYYNYNYYNWRTAFYTLGGTQVVLGTFLNLWLLVAILTCPSLRQSMRNKLICNLAVALALESMITLPVDLAKIHIYRSLGSYYCQIYSLVKNLQLINDFISSWIVVIILVFYLADILDYDPSKRLTALLLRLTTAGVLLLPWVGSLITVPSIMADYYNRIPDTYRKKTCFHPTFWSFRAFKSVDTVLPVILSIVLITLAIIFRRRRFALGRTMSAELIGPGRELDSPLAYITVVAIVIVCQFLALLDTFDVFRSNFKFWAINYFLSLYMDSARVILLPLSCLLLPDLRQRLLTWRPRKRPLTGIDLTFVYEKDTS